MSGLDSRARRRPAAAVRAAAVVVRAAVLRAAAVFACGSACVFVGGCAGADLFTDLTSVSSGSTNGGRLRRPEKLPWRGRGYVVPPTWRTRGLQFGTRELVRTLLRAASEVRNQEPRAILGIADLSYDRGGKSGWHKSHQSGRDVDLLFFTSDALEKRPLPPPSAAMVRFGGDGRPVVLPSEMASVEPGTLSRRFDDRLNWALLESLLRDPNVRLQWIFVSDPLRARLLDYAAKAGRPAWLIEYAEVLMREPKGALPHDNHFHIRIYCPRSDRRFGCQDTGPVWQHEKKTMRFAGPERFDPPTWLALVGAEHEPVAVHVDEGAGWEPPLQASVAADSGLEAYEAVGERRIVPAGNRGRAGSPESPP